MILFFFSCLKYRNISLLECEKLEPFPLVDGFSGEDGGCGRAWEISGSYRLATGVHLGDSHTVVCSPSRYRWPCRKGEV